MNLKEKRAAELAAAQAIVDGAKAAVRGMTEDEKSTVDAHLKTVDDLDVQIKNAEQDQDRLRRFAALTPEAKSGVPAEPEGEKQEPARDLAELYVKSGVFEKAKNAFRSGEKYSFATPELKAAADPILTSGTGGLPTQYGDVLATKYRQLTIADLLSSGSMSASSLTYWTQGTLTGDVAPVAEGASKPGLNFAFGQVTETPTKLAGRTKVSDEMTEDADFMVSVIRSQLLLRLGVVEEDQLLNGSGTAPALRGILNRSGIQTYSTTSTASAKKWLDGLFHAQNLVRTGSFTEPDGIVVNPADYEYMRLGVDGQSQYYGGGPFTGAYGNGGLSLQPAIWGLPTVVTPAIAQGTALVGSFKTSGQVFRKGGVRLEQANQNEDDFIKNLILLRVEERLALAVYYPTGFVKVTLTA